MKSIQIPENSDAKLKGYYLGHYGGDWCKKEMVCTSFKTVSPFYAFNQYVTEDILDVLF